MHIASIEQAQGDDGLAPISMRGLKRIVVLAGANGSGKSRLLHRITIGANPKNRHNAHGQGFHLENVIANAPVPFVSKNLKLADPSQMLRSAILKSAKDAEIPGAIQLSGVALAYIQRIQTHWWNSSHQNSQEPETVRNEKREQYESLCQLVETVLGEPLQRDFDNNATLFGKPIAAASLSDGQRALLQWSIALHAQNTRLSNLILLLDEPENHLHAESLVSTIDRIANANASGQMWIATHSVPLIASLDKNYPDELSVYYLHQGYASYASEKPELILKSLMGGEQNIEALREFIDLPEVFATNRFAAQCLKRPEVVADDNPADPQVQIAASLTENLKLLDYGCGKGRFLASLSSLYGTELPSKIDYVGWDRDSSNQTACEHVIQNAYGSADGRWYCDRNNLAQHHLAGQFDSVLLCNVLHEIHPNDWVDLFNDGSVINQALKGEGCVQIIEDYLMPKGEYAHPYGFIVLDTEALQKLFGVGEHTATIDVRSERDGRIKGHSVPKPLLQHVTHDSVREALELANRNAKEQIERLRGMTDRDFRAGRAHGFWVQQFANTSLALS